ncbi:MAG: beta-N-acetylglucosaminidase domain-containing protein [Rhizomicrobium sp.]
MRRRWIPFCASAGARATRRRRRRRCAGCRRIAGRWGVRFGVGLSPFELYRDFDDAAKADLARKLAAFDDWRIDDLAILFDDMRGDLPDLAQTQADILHWVQARTKATRLIACPSYYTDDPVLDRFFGQRPQNYLSDLGRLLDRSIEVFWTGEEVCSREYSPGHLARVTAALGRKPFLWDNYPVNDGQRMSQYLHVRAFTGRPAGIAAHLSAHSVNPALQPVLSCIPAISLAESYAAGNAYEYGRAFEHAARAVLGDAFAATLRKDILFVQDVGLERLAAATAERLRQRYGAIDHEAAREIVGWLDGVYKFQEEIA